MRACTVQQLPHGKTRRPVYCIRIELWLKKNLCACAHILDNWSMPECITTVCHACWGALRRQFVLQTQTVHAVANENYYDKKLSYRWQTEWRSCTLCCAVKSCPLVNDCDLLAWFSDFYLPVSHLTLSTKETPSSYRVIFGTEKLEWVGYNLVKVAWWSTQSFGHNTSTWQTYRQPRRHSKSRANALRRAAKNL